MTTYAKAVLSVDSNETRNQLKDLIGFVGYSLLKRHLRNVRIEIDIEKQLVTITKNEGKFIISFDEIEQLVNE